MERAGARAGDTPSLNLLAPRPGHAHSQPTARPEADVIFVAHAGLDDIISIGDV